MGDTYGSAAEAKADRALAALGRLRIAPGVAMQCDAWFREGERGTIPTSGHGKTWTRRGLYGSFAARSITGAAAKAHLAL
jgi:hypothetical protein